MFDFGTAGIVGSILLIIDWVIRIVSLFVVPRNRKPTAATAWLMFIFLWPTLGLLIFLLLGSPKLPKSRRHAQKILDKQIREAVKRLRTSTDSQALLSVNPPAKYGAIANLSEALGHLPVSAGNNIELLPEYDEAIASIVADIERADYFVHLEYFIIAMDKTTEPLFRALASAVNRGVVVRVLYDSVSIKRYPKHRDMLQRLEKDGVRAVGMLPLKFPGKGYVRPDLRNHRKLVVIDSNVAYTGSQNLIQRNYHRKDDIYYDELVVRVHGPAVLQLGAVFQTDWYAETGKLLSYRGAAHQPELTRQGGSMVQLLPSGPGYEYENNLKLFTAMLYSAESTITIVNPYFVPDDALTTALISATRRGVKVTMINSEVMDQWMVGHAQRSFYEVMLEAGVDIYLYDKPILLHTKYMVIDNELATIGSSNMDIRSFQLDLEVTLINYDPEVAQQLSTLASRYLKRSTRVNLEEWKNRPQRQILMDNIARLTSALQ